MELISKQEIIDRLDNVIENGALDSNGFHPLSAEVVRGMVEQLPSAQPEIIRCRECKFASGDSRICMKFDHSPIGELDFCSFAERREDG